MLNTTIRINIIQILKKKPRIETSSLNIISEGNIMTKVIKRQSAIREIIRFMNFTKIIFNTKGMFFIKPISATSQTLISSYLANL